MGLYHEQKVKDYAIVEAYILRRDHYFLDKVEYQNPYQKDHPLYTYWLAGFRDAWESEDAED